MNGLLELIRNDTSIVGGGAVLITGLLTGPVFHLDAAAVGSIMGIMAFIISLWVRSQVYSKKGAAQAVVNAATSAVAAITADTAGGPGAITPAGEAAVANAAKDELNVSEVPDPAPSTTIKVV